MKLDISKTNILEEEILKYSNQVKEIHETLHKQVQEADEYVGWLDLDRAIDKEELLRIKESAKRIRSNCQVLLVIGIGGSYLGARAVIEALSPYFKEEKIEIIYAGYNLSSTYLKEVKDYLQDKDFAINVISKSGTTLEPAIAFRIFKELIEEKYGVEEARKRIFVTTDKEKGALCTLAKQEGYERFVVPQNIGGRYSVLSAVGFLPIATLGIDIDQLLEGAKLAQEKYNQSDLASNECYKYAVVRNILYKSGKKMELLVTSEGKLHYFTEWWKQLFGESEGKEFKGIFPVGVEFTRDLHSLGQYIQEGERTLFETVLIIQGSKSDIVLKEDEDNLDGLNYLKGKTINYVMQKALEGTVLAHVQGDVPNILIQLEELNEKSLGYLIYFFELACAMSGSILGVNPFNQPGVEKYKQNMFLLLGKNN